MNSQSAHARRYIEQLFMDAGIVELRATIGTRWVSGLYDCAEALIADATPMVGRHNLYVTTATPQGVTASNAFGTGRALCNADMVRINRILFDFDPSRQKDSNSTDAELGMARDRALDLASRLDAIGWPAPSSGTSGNGWHLAYRVRLPADEATASAFSLIYQELARHYSDDAVLFDSTVRNPARIWRLPGSINLKGPNTADRPQRRAITRVPNDWLCVSRAAFKRLVEICTPQPAPDRHKPQPGSFAVGRGDYSSLDVVRWFEAHGHYHQPGPRLGMHFVRCPWEATHTTESPPNRADCCIWEASGGSAWPSFHCKHAHCASRTIRDVMATWEDGDKFCAQVFGGAA